MTNDGIPVRWTRGEIAFRVDQRLRAAGDSVAVKEALMGGFEAWRSIPTSRFVFSGHATPNLDLGTGRRRDGVTDVILVERGWEFDRSFAGLTLVTYDPSNGKILDADILLNGEDRRFATEEHDDGEYDLGNVFTHELGHLIGLGHSEESEATMWPSSQPGEIMKRSLATDDVAAFEALYPDGEFMDATAPACSLVAGGGARGRSNVLLATLFALVGLSLARGRRGRWTGAFLLFLALSWTAESDAAVVEYRSVQRLAAEANTVLRGHVLERTSRWEGEVIVTDVKVGVEECWRGSCSRRFALVQEVGGEVDGLGMLGPEESPLVVGAEVVVFAVELRGRLLPTGGMQAVFSVDPATEMGRRDIGHLRNAPRGITWERASLRALRDVSMRRPGPPLR